MSIPQVTPYRIGIALIVTTLMLVILVGSACNGDDSDPTLIVNNDNSNGDNNGGEVIGDPVPVEPQCEDGLDFCDGQCIDTDENPLHCGNCGETCDEGQLCSAGVCSPPEGTCPENSCTGFTYCHGGTGVCRPGCSSDSACHGGQTCDLDTFECECPDGQRLCGGKCFAEDDADACGDCMKCPAPSTGTAQCISGECSVQCDEGLLQCGNRCATCPGGAEEVGCDGNECVATACGGNTRLCGGQCSECPSGATELGCASGECVATACPGGERPCGGECVSCPTDSVESTTCDGMQCVANSCVQSSGPMEACDGACVSCPSGGESYECDGSECIVDCGSDQHLCGDQCVDSTSTDHCGSSCSPCPTIAGGAPECIEGRCQNICADDRRPCDDGCCTFSTELVSTLDADLIETAFDSQGDLHIAIKVGGRFHYGEPSGSSWSFQQLPEETEFAWEDPFAFTLDGDDEPHIFFYGSSTISGRMVTVAYRDNGTWSEVELTVGDDGYSGITADTDPSGAPTAVYAADASGGSEMHMGIRDGDDFPTYIVAENIGYSGGYPDLALDSSGIPHVVYNDDSGSGNPQVVYRYFDFNDSEWHSEDVVSTTTSYRAAYLALDSNEEPMIFLVDGNDYRFATRQSPGNWDIETITTNLSRHGATFDTDSDGVPHITFADESDDQLYYGHRLYGYWTVNPITEATDIDTNFYSAGPHITLDGDDPYILYQNHDGNVMGVR